MKKIFFILIFSFLLINKTSALIQIDITRGNLDPLPIAVSPLHVDIKSENQENLKIKELGEKISINGFWETKEESVFVSDKIENLIKNKIKLSEITILFRISAHTRSFEERLINLGLPYKRLDTQQPPHP